MEKKEYYVPSCCPKCGSTDIIVTTSTTGNPQGHCSKCGHGGVLPLYKNRNKRTTTSLSHWSESVISNQHCCHICGSTENLVAHHIIPYKNSVLYRNRTVNGLCLCEDCHKLVHGLSKEYRILYKCLNEIGKEVYGGGIIIATSEEMAIEKAKSIYEEELAQHQIWDIECVGVLKAYGESEV